ncbi:MAG: polysaccharide deacetylase family protein [Chitinivibrionales bacterium]|nr:polysaccharide deacetylase family protein [Chitinivibrionales bacterium]
MHLTPALLWSCSLGFVTLIWVLFPPLRLLSSGLLIAHVPLLAWGIADIRSRFFGPVLISRRAVTDAIALTFDDGPDPALTPRVLDLLAEHGCRATFFVIAARAREHPELVKRAFDEGHTIACHDLRHDPWSNFRLGDRIVYDVRTAQDIIEEIIGQRPLLYRPPVGMMNPHVLPAIRRLDMQCVGWSRRAGDAGNRRAARIARIPTLAVPGAVVLLHDTLPIAAHRELVIENFRALLERVREQGLRTLTVDTYFAVPAYA